MNIRVDLPELSRPQIERLCVHLYERAEVLLAANVSLLKRLSSGENTSPDVHIAMLNEWSAFQEHAITKSDEAIKLILSVRNLQ